MKWLISIIFTFILLISFPAQIRCGVVYANKQHILRTERLKDLKERHKELMINSIIYVESRGNPKAYNKVEEAVGILQIRPIMLNHANQIIGYKKFSLEDRWCPIKSKEIFWIVQEHGNPGMYLDQACHLWNAGINDKRRWGITEGYRDLVKNRYSKLLNEVV